MEISLFTHHLEEKPRKGVASQTQETFQGSSMFSLLDRCQLRVWRSYPFFLKSHSLAPKWPAWPGVPALFLWLVPSSALLTPSLLCSNLLYGNPSPQPPDKSLPFSTSYFVKKIAALSSFTTNYKQPLATPFLAFIPSDSLLWGLILSRALDPPLLPITYLLSPLFRIFSFSLYQLVSPLKKLLWW